MVLSARLKRSPSVAKCSDGQQSKKRTKRNDEESRFVQHAGRPEEGSDRQNGIGAPSPPTQGASSHTRTSHTHTSTRIISRAHVDTHALPPRPRDYTEPWVTLRGTMRAHLREGAHPAVCTQVPTATSIAHSTTRRRSSGVAPLGAYDLNSRAEYATQGCCMHRRA